MKAIFSVVPMVVANQEYFYEFYYGMPKYVELVSENLRAFRIALLTGKVAVPTVDFKPVPTGVWSFPELPGIDFHQLRLANKLPGIYFACTIPNTDMHIEYWYDLEY